VVAVVADSSEKAMDEAMVVGAHQQKY